VTRSVLFTPAVQAELIEREAPGLGARFRAEVDRVAEHLAANPLQFRTMLADVRRARLRRFPYGLSNMTQGSS
jgi:hypothetical protein